jgi:peptidoglycan/LPS O-acetylase OafA/YrhL
MPAAVYLYRRVVRLYPMFIVGLLLGTAILYCGARSGALEYRTASVLGAAALNMLYIPFPNAAQIGFEVGQVFPANPPAWSLFLEMLASGAFLLLFRQQLKTLLLVAAACYAALIVAGVYYARDGAWVQIHNGFYTSNFFGGLPRAGFGFSTGVALHALARIGVGSRLRALIARLPCPSFLLYAALLVMFLFPRTAHGLYPPLALATVAPAIVFVGAQIRMHDGLERKIAVFLGWISYPIYCLHFPIIRLAILLYGNGHGQAYAVMGAAAVVTLVLAVVLTRWYEEPVRTALSGRAFTRTGVQISKAG